MQLSTRFLVALHLLAVASGFNLDEPVAPGDHASSQASLSSIFSLCVCMYGGIAFLWAALYTVGVQKENREFLRIGLLCITWCSTSVGMHVLNKSLEVALEAPFLISIVQMVIAVMVVGPLSINSFMQTDIRQTRTWLIVPFCFAGMLCTSFYTYTYISLSLLTVIRNLTPLIVLPIERLLMPVDKQPHIGPGVVVSIFIMLSGALIYAGGLSKLSMVGVAFALFNMVLAVTDRLIQRRLLTDECKDMPSNLCTLLNNLVGIFPLLALAGGTGQLHPFNASEMAVWTEPRTCILLGMSGMVGIGICYIGFECQRAISATSFFVLQNMSKVAVVTCGVVFFHDPFKSVTSMLGLALSIGGSAMYGKIQIEVAQIEREERKKLQP